jgi:hypothetical protein
LGFGFWVLGVTGRTRKTQNSKPKTQNLKL